jgi:hypothetical protein
MHRYTSRFELKPGRWVYLPTDEAKNEGDDIVDAVRSRWHPNRIFFHLHKRRGHVAAMKRHMRNRFFAKRDIENFFWQITRARVSRSLQLIGFSSKQAFDYAWASTVADGQRKHLPYGFVQSPLLATLALEKSGLGRFLLNAANGITVSVFMDDIAMSSNDDEALREFEAGLDTVAERSGFTFSAEKTQHCSEEIEHFNCFGTQNFLEVKPERMMQFAEQISSTSEAGVKSILAYVRNINLAQAVELQSSLG